MAVKLDSEPFAEASMGLAVSPPVLPPSAGEKTLPRLGLRKTAGLFATPVVLFAVAWGGPSIVYPKIAESRSADSVDVVHPQAMPDGARLYAKNCANCHGERGDGRGVTGQYLDPPARDFGEGKFRLASTDNPLYPTDDDLLAVLHRGIPGSAMPSFEGQLTRDEMLAVIGHVRELTRQGVLKRRCKKADDDGGDVTETAVAVEKKWAPGNPVAVPPLPPATPASLAHGRQVYLLQCAQCHGQEGRGDGPQVRDPSFKNDNGWPARPRDLTTGVFKCGGDPAHIYTRVMLGMPGTPMPANDKLSPQDAGDVVNYVLSLSRPAAAGAGPGTAHANP